MKTHHLSRLWALIFFSAAFLCAFSLRADPISLPERPVAPEITFLICAAIFLEAVCIVLMLRRFRKPRGFIFWILGLHVVTYPAFLGWLWLWQDIRPAYAAAMGEGLVVLVEGSLIYLICRFVSSAKVEIPRASLFRCLMASLIGNAVSAGAFPILVKVWERF